VDFDQELSRLKGHCHLQRALIEDNEIRTWEITFANGKYCLYKLHDYGHRWLGNFASFAAA